MTVYTVREVAQMLKTTENTIRRAIRDGRLTAIRIDRGYRITQEALDSYLKEQSN